MASTYSQYKIELVGTGEQAGTWGTTTNNNFGSATPGTYQGFEQAIGGRADVTMSGTTTLSLTNSNAAQDARALYLNLSGTLSGAADLVVPALQKSYLVKNGTTGGFAVTIKVTGQTGVSIPNGKTVWVYNNGTDVVTAVDFIPEIATTTVDTTNIEVTNIKAKDGTAAGSIADSTGVVTLASSVLTTTDINGGTIDGAVIGGASADAGSFTTLNTSGQVVFNDAGADVDFRVEGDTEANLLFVDASADKVGIGTSSPSQQLELSTFIAGAPTGTGFVGGALRLSNLTDYESNYDAGGGNPDFLGSIEFYSGDASTGTGVRTAIKTSVDTYYNVNSLCFYTAPGNTAGILKRMSIDSSGNVGIGTTPDRKLVVLDSVDNNLPAAVITKTALTGANSGLQVHTNEASASGGSFGFRVTSGSTYDSPTNEIIRVNQHGLCFNGDTTAADALDDYEQGIWTATLTCGTSGTITLQVANQTGLYTKIGRTVNVSGYIVVNSVASPLGRLTLGGFPFSQIADGRPVGFPYLTTTNAYTGVAVLLGDGAVSATIDRNAGTGADPAVDFASAIKANTEIYFNLTYTTS
jgi:hypothetical protein